MLSYKSGNEIAVVKKDNKLIKTIYIRDIDDTATDTKEQLDSSTRNDELLPRSFYTTLRNVTPSNMILLKRAIRTNNKTILPNNKATEDAYEQAVEILKEQEHKQLKVSDGIIQIVPPSHHWAMSVYGASGCGKSTFVAKFMAEFKRKHKDRPIYVFSSITDDPAFKKAKPVYIKIDESILSDPFMVHEFSKALVVFDDLESLRNDLFSAVNKFRDCCLEVGRHHSINTISINHVIQGGAITKRLQNEANITILYPRTNVSAINKLCKSQYGMSNNDIKELIEMGKTSRWVAVFRDYPSFIVSEKQIKVL